MKINILASGSTGNCIAITAGNKTILIDAGIAKTKIEKALMNVNIRPDQVEAIFVTHAHGDHVKGLPIANKYGIPVFAGAKEWQSIKGIDEEHRNGISEDYCFGHGPFLLTAFRTHHDSFDPVGYTIQGQEEKISVCLDTGHIDPAMLLAMADSDIYIIESNHEPRMVEASAYPNSVKARIISHIGHLSNQQTAEALSKLVRGSGEQIYLVHLSNKNNMPALAEMTVKRELLKKGLTAGKHYELEVV
ncbi:MULTISPECIES: MBL fold metallo-hydrolase [unclassified Sporosarcina]|uniref:MBL fold metallo-hydrolase n=1 Tax=unclassified Sporosarcina TaxID=2647733 RepID=UPI00203F1156|nr:MULTISPECIES: MBL fold metallo-hydrolase [unclassified Sporosarcina]GKV66721.1 metallo-hydrolase [Sporosarcina sp. NCCP-2331]GLB57096.1 metallo-hydrolase [Sporosarcina sp. NCCP-2378]